MTSCVNSSIQSSQYSPQTVDQANQAQQIKLSEINASEVTNTNSGNLTVAGLKLIDVAHTMSIDEKVIVSGSCWDYLNEVYNRAGYPSSKRATVFSSRPKKGPYAFEEVQAGDWLYFVNHSYHDVPHSGMFIQWEDKTKKKGVILSYAGEHKKLPARYKVYDLSHIYQIIRPKSSPK